jgi:phosphopantetheine adenylyltransferase
LAWIDYFSQKLNIIKIVEKKSLFERACYEATNIYELMIFNNYTIDEIIDYMNISYKEEFENNKYTLDEKNYSNIIFNRFYQQLYLIFDLKKEKKMVGNLYNDFDDLVEFNCSYIYKSMKYELLEEIDKILPNMELKEKLTEVCQFSQIFSTKDVKTIFERHFQYIKSGIITLKDFSYEGLNKHINDDIIGKVSFFFLSTTIYIIEVTTSKPMIGSIKKIYYLMNKRFLVMEIIFIFFGVVLIVIIIFFYFYNINELYKQIFLLKKTFNIYKSYE